MRCYNCNKNFDYEKYYGICPKCGCFNQQQSREERHGELHDRFGDESDHRNTYEAGPEIREGEQAVRRGTGNGLLAAGIVVLVLGILVFASGLLFSVLRSGQEDPAIDGLTTVEYAPGESFAFQGMRLRVEECRLLADREVLPGLPEGMKLAAVRISGEGDGEYEDYNRITSPHLEMDGHFRESLSTYAFEPYAQMLGVNPLMEESFFCWETEGSAWYGFLADEEAQTVRIWFDEYDWSSWEGGNLLCSHTVELEIEEPDTEPTEGGGTDAEQAE